MVSDAWESEILSKWKVKNDGIFYVPKKKKKKNQHKEIEASY